MIQATSAVAAVGAVGAAWPFVKYWTPSAKAKAAGAAVKIDVSKLAPGEMLSPIVAWRGKPIFVVYREQGVIDSLKVDTNGLADPDSANPDQQPEFAVNPWRSERPELGVYVGICTHLGVRRSTLSQRTSKRWAGRLLLPVSWLKFDLAGRVVEGVPAPYNLEVPPYRFESDTVIVIG